jgi:hypothetical protein
MTLKIGDIVEPEPLVKPDMDKQGEPKVIYVAPIYQRLKGGKRKVVGERLTQLLPASGGQLRYYTINKRFRVATPEDIKRLTRTDDADNHTEEDSFEAVPSAESHWEDDLRPANGDDGQVGTEGNPPLYQRETRNPRKRGRPRKAK